MQRKKFNIIASVVTFALGAVFLFQNKAGITANVIGSNGSSAGLTSILGIVMIIGAMILFEVSMSHADTQELDLERLVRRTKDHEEIYSSQKARAEPDVEIHKPHHEQHAHKADHVNDKKEE